MSDLIKLLRDPLEGPNPKSIFSLCNRAADRIEELTAYNEEHQSINMMQEMYIERLEEEIKQLKKK